MEEVLSHHQTTLSSSQMVQLPASVVQLKGLLVVGWLPQMRNSAAYVLKRTSQTRMLEPTTAYTPALGDKCCQQQRLTGIHTEQQMGGVLLEISLTSTCLLCRFLTWSPAHEEFRCVCHMWRHHVGLVQHTRFLGSQDGRHLVIDND